MSKKLKRSTELRWKNLTKRKLRNVFEKSSGTLPKTLGELLPPKSEGMRKRKKNLYVKILQTNNYYGLQVEKSDWRKIGIKNNEDAKVLGIYDSNNNETLINLFESLTVSNDSYNQSNVLVDSADAASFVNREISEEDPEKEGGILISSDKQSFTAKDSNMENSETFFCNRPGHLKYKIFPNKNNCGPIFSNEEKLKYRLPLDIFKFLYFSESLIEMIIFYSLNQNQPSTHFLKSNFHSEIFYCQKKKLKNLLNSTQQVYFYKIKVP